MSQHEHKCIKRLSKSTLLTYFVPQRKMLNISDAVCHMTCTFQTAAQPVTLPGPLCPI